MQVLKNLFAPLYSWVSSVYWWKDTIPLLFWMSGMSPITSTTGEMNKTKRRWLRTEPCGRPVNEVSQEEDDESMLTKDERFVKYEWIQVWTVLEKPMKKGGVVQSVKSSRLIESSKNCDLYRINGVHDTIGQFEQSCFRRMELSICRLKGWKTGRNGKMRKEAS